MNALVYVDIDQAIGIHYEKIKVAQNEKRKKLRGFSYYKNIAHFEAFWATKTLAKTSYFWGVKTTFFLSHHSR